MRGVAGTHEDIERVLALVSSGLSDYEAARRTGVPRSTVQNWRRGRLPKQPALSNTVCAKCGGRTHEFTELPASEYAYLLGQYLGDGTICRIGRSLRLSISSDAQYEQIIHECCDAIAMVRGRRPNVRMHQTKRLAIIASYWRAWACLFPQHGSGRKHRRTIELVRWQLDIVERRPGQFLRGLIHSDGWRGINRVHVKGRTYEYPRYQFSNRSDDIRQLFVYTCNLIGVACRPWGKYHISVARRDAVELLDQFVGSKR